jgi:hypothetical protein
MAGDDGLRSLGDDRHDGLRRVADGVLRARAGNFLVALDQVDLDLAAEGRWLRVEQVDLVRAGRQVDRRPVLGAALRPAIETELAGHRRTVVAEVDLDRHPRSDAGVTAEQDARLHGGRVAARGEGRGGQQAEPEDRDGGGEEQAGDQALLR